MFQIKVSEDKKKKPRAKLLGTIAETESGSGAVAAAVVVVVKTKRKKNLLANLKVVYRQRSLMQDTERHTVPLQRSEMDTEARILCSSTAIRVRSSSVCVLRWLKCSSGA